MAIRESEVAYLLGRHNRHHEVRWHVRHGRRAYLHLRTTRGGYVLAACIVAAVVWKFA
jgi:hypothetical protein